MIERSETHGYIEQGEKMKIENENENERFSILR